MSSTSNLMIEIVMWDNFFRWYTSNEIFMNMCRDTFVALFLVAIPFGSYAMYRFVYYSLSLGIWVPSVEKRD